VDTDPVAAPASVVSRSPRAPTAAALAAVTAAALWSCSPRNGTIGAVLAQSKTDGTVRVREVPAALGSARAGLEPGDEVLLVDGFDVRILSPQRLHEALEGPVGSTVRLTVLHRGTIARLEVVRGSVP
jgi:C-terminal processing protease CtpA/Prc